MTELLGGEERIDEQSSAWGDSFIVNFGTEELEKEGRDVDPKDLDNWHVDGDFFVRRFPAFFRNDVMDQLGWAEIA